MRVLFTINALDGHFYPLVPLARALTEAGHEIAFATLPSYAARVETVGFRVFSVGPDIREFMVSPVMQEYAMLGSDPLVRKEFVLRRVFPEIWPRVLLPDLLKLGETWAPDLVVAENCEFAGRIAAEFWGIPHAAVKVSDDYPYGNRHGLVPVMDALRSSVGLPPDPDGAMLFRYLYLVTEPPQLQSAAEVLPPTAVRLRRVIFDRSGGETTPDWVVELGWKPTVYATMGTVFNKEPDHLERILAALRDEPINLILTVGRDRDPAAFGSQPPNVHVERYVPQSLVFDRCDLVVSHCGSGTMLAALEYGLPMVNIPIAADQPENAARCAALGVGLTVGPEERTPEAIRAAARAVLAEPTYRQTAQRLGAEMRAMPGIETAVKLLEQLKARDQGREPKGKEAGVSVA